MNGKKLMSTGHLTPKCQQSWPKVGINNVDLKINDFDTFFAM